MPLFSSRRIAIGASLLQPLPDLFHWPPEQEHHANAVHHIFDRGIVGEGDGKGKLAAPVVAADRGPAILLFNAIYSYGNIVAMAPGEEFWPAPDPANVAIALIVSGWSAQ
jgi:hypothetical protein